MNKEEERKAFEAWAKKAGFGISRDATNEDSQYHIPTTQLAWFAWLSRAALSEQTQQGEALTELYTHELLDHEGKPTGVHLGVAEKGICEQAYTEGETSKEVRRWTAPHQGTEHPETENPVSEHPVGSALTDSEQYRQQMAGISVAALGYWEEGDPIHPDYDTIALRDVARLYAKYDALFQADLERRNLAATPSRAPADDSDYVKGYEKGLRDGKTERESQPFERAPASVQDEIDEGRDEFERIANAPLKRHSIYTAQYDDSRTNELWHVWQLSRHRLATPKAAPAAVSEIEAALAMFPVRLDGQSFRINDGPPLTADGDDTFFSKKKVLQIVEAMHDHLKRIEAALLSPPSVGEPSTDGANAAFEAWYVNRFKKPLPPDYAGMCDWGTWQAAWRAALAAAPDSQVPASGGVVNGDFWRWLDQAYRYKKGATFTEHNMQVAYEAGAQAAGQSDARDAARYRRIRKGRSDYHGDCYAMTFQGDGDIPVKGEQLDGLVDGMRGFPAAGQEDAS